MIFVLNFILTFTEAIADEMPELVNLALEMSDADKSAGLSQHQVQHERKTLY